MKQILKRTPYECVVKISGLAEESETIRINYDVFSDNEVYINPKANILKLVWTGSQDSIIQIVRNNVIIATLQANTTGQFDFEGQGMCPDNVENTSDLVVTIYGSQGECLIRLSKEGFIGIAEDVFCLATGFWDDSGVWKDQAVWID